MLTDDVKKEIQTAYSTFIEKMSFRPRRGQRLMIAHVAKNLGQLIPSGGLKPLDETPPIIAVEAGTGTGKTLAYSLSSIPVAKEVDRKLIIATATVALQEQILNKDLPLLQQKSGLEFSMAIAKGRRRYVCLAKLRKFSNTEGDAQQDSLLFGIDSNTALISKEGVTLYPELAASFDAGRWNGDRDDWPDALSQELWMPLTADNAECSGRRCPHASNCVVFKARDEIEEADVIVTNHDLVLADLALGGGIILPAPEDTIYVFDEAHNLADKALSQFTDETRLIATHGFIEKSMSAYQNLLKDLEDNLGMAQEVKAIVNQMTDLKQQLMLSHLHFLDVVEEQGQMEGDRFTYRYENGEVPETSRAMMRELYDAVQRLMSPCNRLSSELEAIIGGDDPYGFTVEEAEVWYVLTGTITTRLEALASLANAFSAVDDEGKAPRARWLSLINTGARDDISVNCSAIDAADALRYNLWSRAGAVCLTSATIQALGKFNRFIDKLGLPKHTEQHVVDSPFDHANCATLRIFNDFQDVTDRIKHTEQMAKHLPSLLNDAKGGLVLFSARSQLNDVYDALPDDFCQRVLKQDDYSKQALVDNHKSAVDSGKPSVLFGLASLAEGLDLPGDYCDHVVIAKLPFAVPNEPVTETEAEWFEQQGRNYFIEVTVPDAAVKLVQSSGRLLRSETDKGIITLLDRRVLTKRYGKSLLNSLPPYRVDVCRLADVVR